MPGIFWVGVPGASWVMGNLLTLIFRPLQEAMQISQIDVTIFLMKKKTKQKGHRGGRHISQ